MSEFIPIYNLEAMTEEQRQQYIRNVCAHLGVPDNLNLVNVGLIDEDQGPRRMVAFVKRGAYEVIRAKHGISTEIAKTENLNGSFVVTAVGVDKSGRKEMALGAKYIDQLSGKALDDAIMTAQTRAMNRATLQFIGAGILDESEVQNRDVKVVKNETPISLPPQPTVVPATAPGIDITVTAATMATVPPASTQFHGQQEQIDQAWQQLEEKKRAEAIAKLNAQAAPAAEPEVKKTRRPRTKKTIDLGPSAPVSPNQAVSATAEIPQKSESPVVAAPPVTTSPVLVATPVPQPVASKNRLTPEQIKPFRQRQFQLVTELEHNGFAPKEGMGNLDKMRNFVTLLFPDVTNFNDLSVEQWEKYLTTVETKLKIEGATGTIKYIEESIGV